MSRIVAIIQARVGSKRLPRKVLKKVVGRPVLWHIIQRLKKTVTINEIIVATTVKEVDKPIIKIAIEAGVKTFAGSEEDVLDRYYHAAKTYEANIIVRITADNPLIDPAEVDKIVTCYLNDDFDYFSNSCPEEEGRFKPTYPEGLDTEVISFRALECALEECKLTFGKRARYTLYPKAS